MLHPSVDITNIPNVVTSAVNAIHNETFLADNGNLTEITPVTKIPAPITRIPNVPVIFQRERRKVNFF